MLIATLGVTALMPVAYMTALVAGFVGSSIVRAAVATIITTMMTASILITIHVMADPTYARDSLIKNAKMSNFANSFSSEADLPWFLTFFTYFSLDVRTDEELGHDSSDIFSLICLVQEADAFEELSEDERYQDLDVDELHRIFQNTETYKTCLRKLKANAIQREDEYLKQDRSGIKELLIDAMNAYFRVLGADMDPNREPLD